METVDEAKTLGAGLRSRLWKTRGARFVARERLRATNVVSIATVTALSIYVIVSSVILLAFADNLDDIHEKWLNVVNIGLSILIISFSLIESSRDHLGSAEVMNQSGLRIGELHGELSAKIESRTLTQEQLEKFEADYAAALRESKLNHSDSDYKLFRISKWMEFPKETWMQDGWKRFVVVFYLKAKRYAIYGLALVSYPILGWLYVRHFFLL